MAVNATVRVRHIISHIHMNTHSTFRATHPLKTLLSRKQNLVLNFENKSVEKLKLITDIEVLFLSLINKI